MSCPRTSVCLTPLPTSQATRTPRILLSGKHQPTLLRYLDGWPRPKGRATAFLIQFADSCETLARFGNDRFDLAVVQAPSRADAAEVIHHLTRVARQGLITRA
ncbi:MULTISPECIES: hypothetical protein [Pseudomonas]|uniref:hypothetical protein n=1 Tax=Pseudomonas TaxID=286 RepID=UPI000C287B06|nr:MULTISPECIES: hypothetical protein [Pseudomonas]MEC6745302.1 hypothetical protein [Pseudomonas qingdaonensis]PPS61451.1 hypothetical protein CR917_10890 [Pseudomonas sp. BRM28]